MATSPFYNAISSIEGVATHSRFYRTLVDASIVKSNSKNPQGGEVSERDPEAGWTKKGGQYHHGFKMHACVDDIHGLVQSLEVTSGDVHDSLVFGHLLFQDDPHVYTDKAYDSQKNRTLLKDVNGHPIVHHLVIKKCTTIGLKKGSQIPELSTPPPVGVVEAVGRNGTNRRRG